MAFGLHRHHRVPGLEQHVDQPAARPLDPDRDTPRLA
jgi:hypothetical protein